MKRLTDSSGRFACKLWFEDGEIDKFGADALRSKWLYPTVDAPQVNIETFIKRMWGFDADSPEDALPDGVMGYCLFEKARPVGIFASRKLFDDADKDRVVERRLRSTLAHEAMHALLHGPLHETMEGQGSLFGQAPARVAPKPIMCRDIAPAGAAGTKTYNGEWWEFQANQGIGSFLTPLDVFVGVLDRFIRASNLPRTWAQTEHRPAVERHLSDAFNVSREVVRIRLSQVGVEVDPNQEVLGDNMTM